MSSTLESQHSHLLERRCTMLKEGHGDRRREDTCRASFESLRFENDGSACTVFLRLSSYVLSELSLKYSGVFENDGVVSLDLVE